jgi:hypothetical protein
MAENIEDILCSTLRTTEFSLQLDESTLPGNESLLLAYVRFIKDECLAQEMLFARQLETDTYGNQYYILLISFSKTKKSRLLIYSGTSFHCSRCFPACIIGLIWSRN